MINKKNKKVKIIGLKIRSMMQIWFPEENEKKKTVNQFQIWQSRLFSAV